MSTPASDPQTGLAVLRAFLRERSALGPLRVMAERVGRFFQVPLPGFKPYIVHGPEANRKVLISERHKFLWRNQDPVTDLLRHGVLITDGEEHDHYRALMEPPLHPGRLADYTPNMVTQTDRVTAVWKDGQVIDMLVEGRKIALLIMMQTLCQVDLWNELPQPGKSQTPPFWRAILKAIDFISPGAWILWRNIPRPGYRQPLDWLDARLYQIIRERRAANAPSNGTILDHLLAADLSDEIIRDQLLTMLIAGHDTSTALLAWSFALLGQHPATLRQLHSELDSSLGESAPVAPGGWQPALLDQVIKEALRLYPPIHIGNRMVSEDAHFGEGQTIPAGSRMFYSIFLTHRDPQVWENPSEFCPERFASGRKTPPMSYVPFGGGPRACIGAAFGQAEARVVIARLLQTFDFELIDKKIHPHMGATLEPRPGVRMRVTRRRQDGVQSGQD